MTFACRPEAGRISSKGNSGSAEDRPGDPCCQASDLSSRAMCRESLIHCEAYLNSIRAAHIAIFIQRPTWETSQSWDLKVNSSYHLENPQLDPTELVPSATPFFCDRLAFPGLQMSSCENLSAHAKKRAESDASRERMRTARFRREGRLMIPCFKKGHMQRRPQRRQREH